MDAKAVFIGTDGVVRLVAVAMLADLLKLAADVKARREADRREVLHPVAGRAA